MTKRNKHIAVLMGGLSSEREVSLSSGKGVVEALTSLGYKVTAVDVSRDIAERLGELKPDVAFIALHGTYGEDGCIQGILEYLRIPYTHSGVLASATGMDKPLAKRIFESAGIRCPGGKVVSREELIAVYAMGEEILPRPFVVKPVADGSSVGVHIIREGSSRGFTPSECDFGEQVLVEPYIPGRELAIAVLDGEPLGVIELRPKSGFYDYENKYTAGMTDHLMPAPIPQDAYIQAMEMAAKAHNVLGCRGVTRSDIRYNDTTEGEPGLFLLEINTHPGMTPLSLVPEIAAHCGISFPELLDRLVQGARCDYQETPTSKTCEGKQKDKRQA